MDQTQITEAGGTFHFLLSVSSFTHSLFLNDGRPGGKASLFPPTLPSLLPLPPSRQLIILLKTWRPLRYVFTSSGKSLLSLRRPSIFKSDVSEERARERERVEPTGSLCARRRPISEVRRNRCELKNNVFFCFFVFFPHCEKFDVFDGYFGSFNTKLNHVGPNFLPECKCKPGRFSWDGTTKR